MPSLGNSNEDIRVENHLLGCLFCALHHHRLNFKNHFPLYFTEAVGCLLILRGWCRIMLFGCWMEDALVRGWSTHVWTGFRLSSLDRRSAAPLSALVRHRACTVIQQQCEVQALLTTLRPPAGGGRAGARAEWQGRAEKWQQTPGSRSQGAMKKVTGMKNRGRVMEDNQRDNAPVLWLPVFLTSAPGFHPPPPPPPVGSVPRFLPSAARSSALFALDTAVRSSSLTLWWRDDWRGEQVMKRWQEPSASMDTRSFPSTASFRCFRLHTFSSSEAKNI